MTPSGRSGPRHNISSTTLQADQHNPGQSEGFLIFAACPLIKAL